MISAEMCKAACNLSQADVDAVLREKDDRRSIDQMLRSYGPHMDLSEFKNLLVYHFTAAVDLGLDDHARNVFGALREFLDMHPELMAEDDGEVSIPTRRMQS